MRDIASRIGRTTAMTIALHTPARIQWTRVTELLTSGQRAGNFTGLVEHRGTRFITTDGIGAVVGTFDTERAARAALEPDALERTEAARRLRSSITMAATGVAALVSTGIAVAGMLHLLA